MVVLSGYHHEFINRLADIMRFILIFIALATIVMVLKRLWQPKSPEKSSRIPSNKMVQCAHCGIYTPIADATESAEKYYCSQVHCDEDNQG